MNDGNKIYEAYKRAHIPHYVEYQKVYNQLVVKYGKEAVEKAFSDLEEDNPNGWDLFTSGDHYDIILPYLD